MEIIKKDMAEGYRFRFPQLRRFPQAFVFLFGSFSFFNEFPPGMPAGSRYEYATRLFRRFEETFERDQDGESDICSDVVLRGLAIRVMGALCR
jgi:hypothetical protein